MAAIGGNRPIQPVYPAITAFEKACAIEFNFQMRRLRRRATNES